MVPQILRRRLFDASHSGPLAAHLGAERMIKQLKSQYYWPGLNKDVHTWCQECHQCQSSKGPPARPHGRLQKVITGEPLDIVAIVPPLKGSYLQPKKSFLAPTQILILIYIKSHSSKTVELCYFYSSSLLYYCCITITTTLHIVT